MRRGGVPAPSAWRTLETDWPSRRPPPTSVCPDSPVFILELPFIHMRSPWAEGWGEMMGAPETPPASPFLGLTPPRVAPAPQGWLPVDDPIVTWESVE